MIRQRIPSLVGYESSVGDHSGKKCWKIVRQIWPWRRVVRPVDFATLDYRPYRVTSVPARDRERAAQRRQRRKEASDQRRDQRRPFEDLPWWGKVWRLLIILPVAVAVGFVLGPIAEGLELVLRLGQLLVWLMALPLALIEVLLRLVALGILSTLRALGLARHRIDVINTKPSSTAIRSLSILKVHGLQRAGQLVREIDDHIQRDNAFNPRRDPALIALLTSANAEVVFHESLLEDAGPQGLQLKGADQL